MKPKKLINSVKTNLFNSLACGYIFIKLMKESNKSHSFFIL